MLNEHTATCDSAVEVVLVYENGWSRPASAHDNGERYVRSWLGTEPAQRAGNKSVRNPAPIKKGSLLQGLFASA